MAQLMRKILVIEDDLNIRNLILKLLQAEGFEAVGAADGALGIEIAQSQMPDLIICDIMMPKFDGYEVIRQLRTDPATASIPFIFLSAKTDRADQRRGMNLGADDYLEKPFTRNELLSAIAARLVKHTDIIQPYFREMKQATESLKQLVHHTPLPNLSSRQMLNNRLQAALAQAKDLEQRVALFCLNLINFQSINACQGYEVGDVLLQTIANRLKQKFGESNEVICLESADFAILIKGLDRASDIAQVAEDILLCLSEPYMVNGQSLQIQVAIGITLYPEHHIHSEKLLSYADMALAYARSHSYSYQIYDDQVAKLIIERQLIETSLQTALEHHQLYLCYQPQANLITGRITGAEVLLRWQHPELGNVPPNKFLGIAEETDLLLPIERWLLRTACLEAQSWQQATLVPTKLSVNLSAYQFKQKDMSQTIAQILSETHFNPNNLVVELTETSVMRNVDEAIVSLEELKAMGIQVAIDDFGNGYSSLNYLKRLPIDILKVDQSFIGEIVHNTQDAAITKAIIAMAQSLKLKVIAEGVETLEQLHFLRQSGCHMMQGFLFSPPLIASEFEQFLRADRRL
jgi:diguanylate cyclase